MASKYKSSDKKNNDQDAVFDADDRDLFRQAMAGIQPIENDEIAPLSAREKIQQKHHKRQKQEVKDVQDIVRDTFSDNFEGYLGDDKVAYTAPGESSYLAKQLRRGDYAPEMLLDLHGLTVAQAKHELAAMLTACEKELIQCCSVMHGHGTGVLKKQLPHWLIQHPAVRAFHQAPKTFGGDAAVLILLQAPE
ncbi:endonuclease SmrB [Idiomarina sp. UBA3162]|uniref:endonuclease SmrB n=1 Tax=Idiomarina sp. UBA3162 TaxID=1946641 RepID=UPI000C8DD0B7|nr:endonuclease SmrB [Idiomarina sp. UBA3162]MAD53991.1 endonuclease SmrB [Idiomarinaceae bacterium]|tara:strand:- start:777 stop:1352 length:576 start_codon:yes stop_codon:yes gene_type:complete